MSIRSRMGRQIVSPLLLALLAASVPLPCAAQGTRQPAAASGLKASAERAARSVALNAPAPAGKSTAQAAGQAPSSGSKSFFKTTAGVAVLAIIAGGTGYAIYSASHDRIPPQGR